MAVPASVRTVQRMSHTPPNTWSSWSHPGCSRTPGDDPDLEGTTGSPDIRGLLVAGSEGYKVLICQFSDQSNKTRNLRKEVWWPVGKITKDTN